MNTDTPWVKARRSGANNGACVEVRRYAGTIQVRDSKNPDGPVLCFPLDEWAAFVDAVSKGEFAF